MTDPTGRSFLSYRRRRREDAAELILAQQAHGIPTWQDIANLDPGPTQQELEKALADPHTANGVLYITPEIEDSPMIRALEVPRLVRRVDDNDGFFLVTVAAGGLDYNSAGRLASEHLDLEDLSRWNMERAETDPLTRAEADAIARATLRKRLAVIDKQLAPDAPFTIELYTREKAPFVPGTTLALDWAEHFSGREATTARWTDELLPAAAASAAALRAQNPDREVVVGGRCALAGAMSLGRASSRSLEERLDGDSNHRNTVTRSGV